MKIALISDIHANLPALEAVLRHARRREAEAVWNAGDLVGYGPFPDAVVQRLREEEVVSIVGNYDLKMLEILAKEEDWRKKKGPEKTFAFRWAHDQLSLESRQYLSFLPHEIRWTVEGRRVLITHASPASNKEHLTYYTSKKRLRKLAKMADADIVICGHSHRSFVRTINGVLFLNPGSVGRPDDGDPRASYALLTLTPESLDVHHYRVDYEVGTTVSALRQRGLPEVFAQMFVEGYDLDTVLQLQGIDKEVQWLRRDPRAASVLDLAERCDYDRVHAYQVAWLSLELFDALYPLHKLGPDARRCLHYAALLHNIGWSSGGKKKHHKRAARLILDAPDLRLEQDERRVLASVVRYHRKASPSAKHRRFAKLDPEQRTLVRWLAGILRVATGLNYTHRSLIEAMTCKFTSKKVTLRCTVRKAAEAEQKAALRKADLLNHVSGRRLRVKMRVRE